MRRSWRCPLRCPPHQAHGPRRTLQRDGARGKTYVQTNDIVKTHGGAHGLGALYTKAMFGVSGGGQ
ncbi:MAG: hypothetical protein ACFB6R_10810 [Alphaproteobacteria bacterium]